MQHINANTLFCFNTLLFHTSVLVSNTSDKLFHGQSMDQLVRGETCTYECVSYGEAPGTVGVRGVVAGEERCP